MNDVDGPGRCNRCGEPLEEDTPVTRAYSGRSPYQHARPEDCPALQGESPDGEGTSRSSEQ
jgi:hypothetical protein